MIGQRLTPILEEIENAIWEWEAMFMGKPDFGPNAMRAAAKIFAAVLLEKSWELMEREDVEDRDAMGIQMVMDLRKLIKTYTGIDTEDLYK